MAKIFCRLMVNSFLTISPESLVVFYRKGFGKSTRTGKRLKKGLYPLNGTGREGYCFKEPASSLMRNPDESKNLET